MPRIMQLMIKVMNVNYTSSSNCLKKKKKSLPLTLIRNVPEKYLVEAVIRFPVGG